MANPYFQFKQFTIYQNKCAMKVCTEACLFGAWAAMHIKETGNKKSRLLDIGAGTGLLSLMVAQKNAMQLELVEINREAAVQASENCNASSWQKNFKVHAVDIKDFRPGYFFSYIISNPPFYDGDLKSDSADKNLAHHNEALSIEAMLGYIKKLLADKGYFFLLYPFRRWKELEEEIGKHGMYAKEVIFVHPSIGSACFRVMVMGSFEKTICNIREWSIVDEEKAYTNEFSGLLKDYYLYL